MVLVIIFFSQHFLKTACEKAWDLCRLGGVEGICKPANLLQLALNEKQHISVTSAWSAQSFQQYFHCYVPSDDSGAVAYLLIRCLAMTVISFIACSLVVAQHQVFILKYFWDGACSLTSVLIWSIHSMVRVSSVTPLTWRTSFPYLYPPRTGMPSYTPGHLVPFTSSFL
jgi:hypothetical protein